MPKNYSCLVFLFLLLISCHVPEKKPSGLKPSDALKSFVLAPGFKIELVASEPLIADPVAMEVDEKGDIYVVEMHGYPLDTTGAGFVKQLTDTDGDGKPDKSTVFADHLRLPTGIMKWKKGFLVADVPDILYLEDTDLDGRADIKRTMLTGLALTNPQHIANTPLFGIDNWIYLAHMGTITPKVSMEFIDSGTLVRFPFLEHSQVLPRNADGRNIRFRPDSGNLEMLSGESQYGQTFDPWGHQFCTSNANHIFSELIGARYLQRNPALLVANAMEDIPDHGNAAEIFPITINPQHQLLTDVGVITSSCGITWYQGGLFPDSFQSVTFISEPVHNLVHADRVKDKGSSYTASRVYSKTEFLASTDPWCRPVQFYIGPDGALYMIDYYRQIIEHPEWMSDEVNQSGALYNGSDRGRIYRITPIASAEMNWCGRLQILQSTTAQLVNQLGSPNIWWRRNAQRILMDRQDHSTTGFLQNFLDTVHNPVGIVHALWTLEGLGGMRSEILKNFLNHPEAGVRENAIRIAELHLDTMNDLAASLIDLSHDSSPKVRYQLLCTLGYLDTDAAEKARMEILERDVEDPWFHLAALSASGGKEMGLLEMGKKKFTDQETEGKRKFFYTTAAAIGLSERIPEINHLVQIVTSKKPSGSDWWHAACLEGLIAAVDLKKTLAAKLNESQSLLLSCFCSPCSSAMRTSAIKLLGKMKLDTQGNYSAIMKQARLVALDSNAEENFREDALRLVMLSNEKIPSSQLEQLIDPNFPESLQAMAMETYGHFEIKKASSFLVEKWNGLTPGLRNRAMNIFLRDPESMDVLLDAVQNGKVQSSTIGWPRMVELMNNDDARIRKRARELLAPKEKDRDLVLARYKDALNTKGNSEKGSVIFQKICSSCHQLVGRGGRAFGTRPCNHPKP